MPRFSDEWLIDRVLFDYVSGGSCACCGFQHFLPNGTAGLIGAVSDLETDAADQEVAALQNHPWPADLRDQVWADRVRLRQKLKKDMKDYRQFWDEHGPSFSEWCRQQDPTTLKRIFQLARSEIMETLRQKYNIHSAYAVVLCAVVEQVAHFELTLYAADGRGLTEVDFEKELRFDRRGGFTLNMVDSDGAIDERVLEIWCRQMETLGGPKLLQRGKNSTNQVDGEEEEEDGDEAVVPAKAGGPSFQSDRRIIRLLIARYWADLFQKRYRESLIKDNEL